MATPAASPTPPSPSPPEEPDGDDSSAAHGPVEGQLNFYIRGDEPGDPTYKFVAQIYRDVVIFDAELYYQKEAFTQRGRLSLDEYQKLLSDVKSSGLDKIVDDRLSDSHFSFLSREPGGLERRGVLYSKRTPDAAIIEAFHSSIVGSTYNSLIRRAGAPTLDLWRI